MTWLKNKLRNWLGINYIQDDVANLHKLIAKLNNEQIRNRNNFWG